MASRIPRVASTARQLIAQGSRAPVSRFAASTSPRPAIFFLQRRYASHAPHYDPAPKPIEDILYIQHAEPSTPEEWKEIGISALRACKTQADRDAVQAYITNQLKPKLTDEEVIAVASQVGVNITTPEELESAHAVFKQVMTSATLTEAEALFTYFEKTGEFPADIKTVLADSFTKAATSQSSAADHHDHHDDHGHGHGSAHAETKEAFGIGWYLALGAIPFSAIIFFLTRSKTSEGNEPYITRLISKYDHWREEWALRNELHTKSVEQAGFDRLLFRHAATSEGRGVGRKDVRFEDSINQGPPINVTPGSYANVDKVIEHYKKLNEETEEKRLKIEEYYREKARQAA